MSAGIRIAPIAKVVATLEPDTAAKIMQVSTHVAASPPCTPPTSDFANSTSRDEIPPDSIRLPARMKKGIAASGNLLIDENISFTTARKLRSAWYAPTRLAMPIDTATEIDSANASTIVRSIVPGMVRPYCAVSSSWRRGSMRQAITAIAENAAPTGIARYAQVIENDSSPLIVWNLPRYA
jgi:hypothetical protein